MKDLFRVKGGVLSTWIFSYLLILALPVLTWIASFYISNEIIRMQTDKINDGVLMLLCEATDKLVAGITADSRMIMLDENIANLVDLGGISTAQDVYTAMQAQKTLHNFVTRNTALDAIYIYFKDADYVVSNETAASSIMYYNLFIADTGVSMDEWLGLLTAPRIHEYRHSGTGSGGSAVYLISLPISASKQSNVTLVLQLRRDALTSLISRVNTTDGAIVSVISSEGELLATNKTTDEPINSAKYIEARVNSAESGWTYVSLIPAALYTEMGKPLKIFTTTALAAVFILGLCLIIVFLKKNYSPLDEIVKHLETSLQSRVQSQSEYGYLRESIDIVFNSQKKDRKLLLELDEKLKHAYLTRLLLGRADMSVPIEEYFSVLGFEYESNSFVVMLFDFDYSENSSEAPSQSDIINRTFPIYGQIVEIGGLTAFLADCTGFDNASLKAAVISIVEPLSERFGGLLVACSDIHYTPVGIPAAYDEALFCTEYAMIFDGGRVIFYSDISSRDGSQQYYYPPEEERRLMEFISKSDLEAASLAIDRIWERNSRGEGLSLGIARLLMTDLSATFMKSAAEQLGSETVGRFSIDADIFHVRPRTLEDIKSEIDKALRTVCADIAVTREDDGEHIWRRIMDYIDKNYADTELSVEKICDEFGRSRTSLFLIFKEKTGEGILHHVNLKRIEAAKRILRETDKGVNETAAAVGYTSAGTFLRAFKKCEGLTPGRYREIVASGKQTGEQNATLEQNANAKKD